AGLQPGQEILAVDGKAVNGWGAVNLQLIRRLGETGTLQVRVGEPDSTVESDYQITLSAWLRGADEPDPIQSLGLQPWRPAVPAVLAHIDPSGPAQTGGLRSGDRLLSLDGIALRDWQDLVEQVRARADQPVVLKIEREGQLLSLPVQLAGRGDGEARSGYLGAGVSGVDW